MTNLYVISTYYNLSIQKKKKTYYNLHKKSLVIFSIYFIKKIAYIHK